MKKFTAIICALALLTALTGCNNNETSGSVSENTGVSAPESTTENTESSDSSENSESTPESPSVPESNSAQVPHSELSEQAREILERCTLDLSQVKGIDDEPLSEEDIVDAYVDERVEADCLEYGVGYYRIARPLYYSETGADYDTMSELLWEKMDEFEADTGDASLKKARVGDTLENGLTVKEAKTVIFGDGGLCESYIALDGELTLEGVLFREMQDHDYMFRARDLTFSPDCTKSSVPTLFGGIDFGFYIDEDGTITVVVMDGTTYFLGNLDEIDFDEQGIFGDGSVAKVKVTVDNIKIGVGAMPISEAEIVDIERID
ncbi:MAG: hypothetical protein HDT43_01160 [Ruminococcaceae bacterium]|nr:hypothetical protein [Oscillospiraceae bacterium]